MNTRGIEDPAIRVAAVIPAAGAGLRMGGGVPKQFLEIDGRPLLALTLEAFENCSAVDRVVLVVPSVEVDYCRRAIVERYCFKKVAAVVAGGKTRRDSVRLGLSAVGDEFDLVVVHDGARPLVRPLLIERVIDGARATGAAIAGIPARDTVKEVDGERVVKTCDREKVWLAQTPQAFRRTILLDAHSRTECRGEAEPTDDASLVERAGGEVVVVPGDEDNIKVTTPRDIALVKFLKSEAHGLGKN
ncbi:MAG TPA: 2-C-methyl-D-erythritol 4-phosphate cytidylyltransferase [Desulfobacteraceae bacterium]|nr:2-C-methyl-D-erythritol 4-phosphate cytidylyltransferase [Desulfobacteraceae bacterium]